MIARVPAVSSALALILATAAFAQPTYDVIDVGDLANGIGQSTGYALNSAGFVVGITATTSSGNRGFIWNPSTGIMTSLAALPGSSGGGNSALATEPYAINALSTIVGRAYVYNGATYVSNHATRWDAPTTAFDLAPIGTRTSVAWAINADGIAAGTINSTTGIPVATLWYPDGSTFSLTPLPTETFAQFLDINDEGTALGQYNISGTPFWGTFIRTPDGTRIDLPFPSGTTQMTPTAINNSRTVVGYLRIGTGGATRPFMWTPTTGTTILNTGSVTNGAATAINDSGTIVGWHGTGVVSACAWYDPAAASITLSSRLTPTSSAWGIIGGDGPYEINSSGWILVQGLTPARPGRYQHAAILAPSNPCPTFSDQPDNRTFSSCTQRLFIGASAASRNPITYSWTLNGQPITDGLFGLTRIRGSASPVIIIDNPTSAYAGNWVCIATNSCGTAQSNPAAITFCPPDFNCDAVVDFFDYLDFVAAFAANSGTSDFNNDFVIDFFDYLDFVAAFADGC